MNINLVALIKLFAVLCERFVYRLCGIQPDTRNGLEKLFIAMLFFNLFGIVSVYFIQRFQFYLPLNPQYFSAIAPDLAFNTAISFVTNTNWQAYSGETTYELFHTNVCA